MPSVFCIFVVATTPSFITGVHFTESNKPMSTKTSINRKEVLAFTEAELSAGKSKQSIFEELSEKYFDSKVLAGYIASVPNPELRERYTPLNTLLVLLLVVAAIDRFFVLLPILAQRSTYTLFISVLAPLFNLWLARAVWKMRGTVYRVVFILAALATMRSLDVIVDGNLWASVSVVLLLAISGLSLYVNSKLFPNVGLGGVRKDSEGNYQF